MSCHVKNRRALQIGLLVVLSAVVFCNTFTGEFIWDDVIFIKDNPNIRKIDHIPLFFAPRYWNESYVFPEAYRPVREVSLAMDYFFWKSNPAGYHLTNLLLHIINTVLVFYLAASIAARGGERPEEGNAGRRFLNLPFLTALFFAVHPIHTESINLIKNRSEPLAFLFLLLSLLLFIRPFADAARHRRGLSLAGAWLCFVPAVLSKETALPLPGLLALYAVCFLTGPELKKALIRIIPYGLILLAYFGFTHAFIRPPAELAFTRVVLPGDIGQSMMTVLQTIGCYLKMLLVPLPLNVEYAFKLPESVPAAYILLLPVGLLLFGAAAVRTYQRSRVVFFSLGWMVLSLLPAANIVYLAQRPLAEQRLYLPSLGFCLLLAYGIERLSRIRSLRLEPARAVALSGALAVVVAGFYAGVTVQRNADWRDPVILFSKALAMNPESTRMHNNLGVALGKEKHFEEAIGHYQTALRLNPDYIYGHFNLALTLARIGRYEEAAGHYQTVLRLNPDCFDAVYRLGAVYYNMGRYQEAIDQYLKVLRRNPDYPGVHDSLGLALSATGRPEEAIPYFQAALAQDPRCAQAHIHLGTALAKANRPEEAISHFQTALALDPNSGQAHINLGAVLAGAGRPEEAIGHFQTALALDPNSGQAHINLGAVLAGAGRPEEAIGHYFDAVRLQPDNIEALNGLALVLVRTGQAAEAIGYYRAALQIMPDNAEVCYNLGAAYAIQGNCQEAAALFTRSLQLVPDDVKIRQAYADCQARMKAHR